MPKRTDIRIKASPMPRVHVMRQARYWMLTIPREDWAPILPPAADWIIGQPEVGESSYRHWQVLVHFARKCSLQQCKASFVPTAHCEPTRSDAAAAYVHKETTRDGEPFEFGNKPTNRNSSKDWENIKDHAKAGELDLVPADVYIRYYRTLLAIASDHERPIGLEKSVLVYYGVSGTGKSRKAWDEAGVDAYSKDPRSKFWCGYTGERNVVLDEFRGGIDVSHMLRWLDRYPVRVEIKGSSRPLLAERIWITSNLHPSEWYPELDEETKKALLRRLQITYFPINIFT